MSCGRPADTPVPGLYRSIDLTSERLFQDYPEQFPYHDIGSATYDPGKPLQRGPSCGTNLLVKTLPGGSKAAYEQSRQHWPRRREIAGPASVGKNIYGQPDPAGSKQAVFPYEYRYVPEGTMYENADRLRQYDQGGKLISYGFRAYPFHHRYVREVETYITDKDNRPIILPYPTMLRWGKPARPVGDGRWGGWGQVAN